MRTALACVMAGTVLARRRGNAAAGAVRHGVSGERQRRVQGAVVIAEPACGRSAPACPAQHAVMDQRELQFVPDCWWFSTGTLVEFPNSDQVRHQVYSFSGAKTFQLPLYAGAPHAPVLFDQPGLVTLGCNIHDDMVGYIYVTRLALVRPAPDADGHARGARPRRPASTACAPGTH